MPQPKRTTDDGPIGVEILPNGDYLINSKGDHLLVSEFNCWRLFAMLSMLLKIKLSKAVMKGIKL